MNTRDRVSKDQVNCRRGRLFPRARPPRGPRPPSGGAVSHATRIGGGDLVKSCAEPPGRTADEGFPEERRRSKRGGRKEKHHRNSSRERRRGQTREKKRGETPKDTHTHNEAASRLSKEREKSYYSPRAKMAAERVAGSLKGVALPP